MHHFLTVVWPYCVLFQYNFYAQTQISKSLLASDVILGIVYGWFIFLFILTFILFQRDRMSTCPLRCTLPSTSPTATLREAAGSTCSTGEFLVFFEDYRTVLTFIYLLRKERTS